ncbi:hypothetical protein DL95DRAFT_452165 [Leptodontidium sp. 2 PMI_412]|nr:hypothetical protein DL95DRAFT_452165 [Leptodontidium sp. 2 PMI_412]
MQHPLYDYNTIFAQQGMETPIFGSTNGDMIIADYTVEELGSPSMDGSMAQSLSPSWVDVGKLSPSVVVEEHTDSLLMVQHAYGQDQRKRTYSEISNLASTVGSDVDFPLYPTPEAELPAPVQEPWTHGADFTVDVEAMSADSVNDPRYWLNSLWTEPRTVPPYQGYPPVIQTQTPVARPRAVKYHSNDPWTAADPQVSGYATGFTAYLPDSPGLQEEQDSERDLSRASSELLHSPQLSKSRIEKSRSSNKSSFNSSKGKAKIQEFTWENVAVSKDGLLLMSENKEEDKQRTGVRNGKLPREVAEKAKRMRKLKACWRCWNLKVPCSEGSICGRCEKVQQSSPTSDQLCCRTGFKDYDVIFFPEQMHSHLKKTDTASLISQFVSRFTDTTIRVEVSTGLFFPPMKLETNVFKPTTNALLRQARLTTGTDPIGDRNSEFEEQESLPIGILAVQQSGLKALCKDHIDQMVDAPEYASQVCAGAGSGSEIVRSLLQIMKKYARKVPIVEDALRLHAMHYFMGSLVTFTPSSAKSVYRCLERPSRSVEPFRSSRLLNRQVKTAMHALHQETTRRVLGSLETCLRSRAKDSWAPSFCAILVLCLCVENLQTAAETMVVVDMMKGEGKQGFGRAEGLDVCQALEKLPLAHCKGLLHDIYRSHKGGNGEFNPLKALHSGEETGLNGKAQDLVTAVYGVIFDKWPEILDLARRGPLTGDDWDIQPGDIRPHHTGRLACGWLKSFIEPEV